MLIYRQIYGKPLVYIILAHSSTAWMISLLPIEVMILIAYWLSFFDCVVNWFVTPMPLLFSLPDSLSFPKGLNNSSLHSSPFPFNHSNCAPGLPLLTLFHKYKPSSGSGILLFHKLRHYVLMYLRQLCLFRESILKLSWVNYRVIFHYI